MYKLSYVIQDRNKYLNTWVGIKDQLVAPNNYDHIGGGLYEVGAHVLSEIAPG
jgi:hypothetical protein